MKPHIHPTRQRLLDATCELLEQFPPDDLKVETVLARSEVSIGSLYHHFADFPDLLETAMIALFAVSVDNSIAQFDALFDTATTRDEFIAGLRQVSDASQSPALRPFRFRRARLLALAEHRPRLRAKLAAEQTRLSATFAEMFRTAQRRGWFNSDFDPAAASVFIQAYTLGKLVDEVTDEPIDLTAWSDLVMKVVLKVFV